MDLIVDNYRTRTGNELPTIARPDPVVWGGGAGPLCDDELSAYARDGFHCTNPVIASHHISALFGDLELLHSSMQEDDPRVIRERTSGRIRTIFDIHELSATAGTVASSPAIVEVARQILGSDVYIHQSRLNFKPGFGAGPFYWHSDFETWHAEDGMPTPRALSVSIALTPNYVHNGSLMIMPGSHTTFVPCTRPTPNEHHRQSLSSDIPPAGIPADPSLMELAEQHGIRLLTGAAGSGIFFDSNCIHGSNGNITPYPRSNLFLVYNSTDNQLKAPFAADTPRPNYLAHR